MRRKIVTNNLVLICFIVFNGFLLFTSCSETEQDNSYLKKEVCKFYPIIIEFKSPWVLIEENYASTDTSFSLNFRNTKTESQYLFQVTKDTSSYEKYNSQHGSQLDQIMLGINQNNQLLDTSVVSLYNEEYKLREYLMFFSGERIAWQAIYDRLDSGYYFSTQLLYLIKDVNNVPSTTPEEFVDFEKGIITN